MKPRIVADGDLRLRRSSEFEVCLRQLLDSVRTQHAAELTEAGFFRRFVLSWRIAAEFRKERRKIEPSPRSVYSSQIGRSRHETALLIK